MSAKIGGLQTAASDAQGFEDALTAAEGDRDDYLAAEGFATAMPLAMRLLVLKVCA